MQYIKKFDERNKEVVFVVRDIIEVRVSLKIYERYAKKYDDEYIISFCPYKNLRHAITGRKLYYINEGIPLIGHTAFGIIDRGTNLIQVRPITGCNLNCIFCSVDEGIASRSRKTDYIVDVDYLLKKFGEVVDYKRKFCDRIEAHIDGQGEPFMYPYIDKLVKEISRMADIVSIQTNGMFIDEEKIKKMENHIDRINLSIHSLNPQRARMLVGNRDYDIEHIKNVAKLIADSRIDLLIAPVWVPGYNDEDIEEIIKFGKEIGAGKIWKPFGIQKFVKYRFGRVPRNVRIMDFRKFFDELKRMDESLILKAEDFGIHKCRQIPKKFEVGDVLKLRLEMDGRIKNEMLAFARDRVIQVIDTSKREGDFVKVRIKRNRHNIYVAEEM
ncbi:MAG: radical SAM protein [Thermoplasmata archaeon]|nr:radical SAM protein [Thermoplasmata archaeon]